MTNGSDKINDTEKLTTILPYIRALDEDSKKQLDRLRQTDGNGSAAPGFGYGELLDKIYEMHEKYEKEKEEQCHSLKEKMKQIEEKLQEHCRQEINKMVAKSIASLRRS